MTAKVYYRKNLKMTPAKLAAQVAHAVCRLCINTTYDAPDKVIVLEARDAKYESIKQDLKKAAVYFLVQTDWGLTELEAGTETVLAFWEK